jgi:hypothetical protein
VTRIAATALALLLSGCAGGLSVLQGLPGQVPGIAGGAVGTIDSTVNTAVIQNAIDQHNLRISLDQINAAPGMVSQVTQPPVIGTPTNPGAPVAVVPSPTPVNPAPIPTPTPVPVPGGPPANLP